MHKFRKIVAAVVLVTLCSAGTASAQGLKEIFEDALYGGLTGTLVGAAVMAFTKKPGNHLDYMSYGAAVGVIAGASYGAMQAGKSLVQIENGKVSVAMPTIMPDIREPNSKGQVAYVFSAELIRGNF